MSRTELVIERLNYFELAPRTLVLKVRETRTTRGWFSVSSAVVEKTYVLCTGFRRWLDGDRVLLLSDPVSQRLFELLLAERVDRQFARATGVNHEAPLLP